MPSRSTDCTLAGACAATNQRLDLGYAYDKHANVTAITDYTTGARQTRGMTYDHLDRLTQTTSAMFGTATYGYNVLDDLTTVNVSGGSKARNHTYVYDPASNRLTNVKNTVDSSTVVGLGYDVQGNLDNKNGVLYDFDFGNRLRTVTDTVGAKTSTYLYDGLGRRVRDTVNGLSKHSHYLQNGQLSMVGDSRTNDVTEYVYLGGSLIATRARDVTTNVYTTTYQHTDALGTPVATTGSTGAFIEKSEYEPYGQQVNVVGAAKDGPGYTGHVQDAATGLVQMQQRYYDPMIGRFLSVDPVAANSGAGANFNRYWYGNNNPYKFTDPDGRAPCIRSGSMFAGCQNDPNGPRPGDPGGACDLRPCGNSFAAGGDGGDSSSSSSNNPIVDLESVEVTIDAADVGLSAHALFLPNKVGDWAQGNMGISKWEGLSPADIRRVRSVAKVGGVVSSLTIGLSVYDFGQAVKERNGYGMVNSGADLGFGLYGLTGPVGAAAAAGYGGMSLLLEIPAVYDHTVTPLVDAACWATSNC